MSQHPNLHSSIVSEEEFKHKLQSQTVTRVQSQYCRVEPESRNPGNIARLVSATLGHRGRQRMNQQVNWRVTSCHSWLNTIAALAAFHLGE